MSDVRIVELANSKLLDENGKDIKMGLLWQQQTALFVFLRHFACIACRAHAVDIWQKKDLYQKGNTKIFFVGNGQPHFIKSFKEDLKIQDSTVYTDPTLSSFHSAGFKRGFLRTVGPSGVLNHLKLKSEGHKQVGHEKGMGDLWQLGGLLVVKPDGKVAYHFISEAKGDFPAEEEVRSTPWIS